MCDDVLAPDYGFTRRRLGALAASATLIAALPRAAHAVAVAESDIVVKTPGGEAEAYLVHPASGKAPAVILWVDILGLRPVYRQVAKRLAESGYAVVAPNPYYRVTKLPAFPADLDMTSPAGLERRTSCAPPSYPRRRRLMVSRSPRSWKNIRPSMWARRWERSASAWAGPTPCSPPPRGRTGSARWRRSMGRGW